MTPNEFQASRKTVQTPSGEISYIEAGEGPAALFVHGFPLNSFFWSGALARLGDLRHCLAPDLMGLGYTRRDPKAQLDFASQAQMLLEFMDALEIHHADLVSNDSGTAIVQILTATAPDRVRSLCLTNGDTHDNYPPEAFKAAYDLAVAGQLADALAVMLDQPELARSEAALGRSFQFPDRLSVDVLGVYLSPLTSTDARRNDTNQYIAAMDSRQMLAVEDKLKALEIPVLVVWGDDDVFFSTSWGRRLVDTFPRSRLEILEGARLFFPAERPEEFCALLREHWSSIPYNR